MYFLTQTVVDKLDKAFTNPTKPVGPYYDTKKEAVSQNPLGSHFVNIPNKGFRRVVPSPKPIDLLCMDSVKEAVKQHKIVVCGGGGGMLAMSEYNERRLKIGSIKAEQIRNTGAEVVISPCHNCIDQLSQINQTYKLGVEIKSVAEIVADALVI